MPIVTNLVISNRKTRTRSVCEQDFETRVCKGKTRQSNGIECPLLQEWDRHARISEEHWTFKMRELKFYTKNISL